jgi:hypothetical protein
VRRAQADGRWFRAVFRLAQAGKKEHLLRRGQVAPDMAGKVLKPGGGALIKAFQGAWLAGAGCGCAPPIQGPALPETSRCPCPERRDLLAGERPAIGVA